MGRFERPSREDVYCRGVTTTGCGGFQIGVSRTSVKCSTSRRHLNNFICFDGRVFYLYKDTLFILLSSYVRYTYTHDLYMLSMYIYMYGIINTNTIEQVLYNESRQLNNVALEQTHERKRAHMEDGATSLLGVFQFQIKHGFMTWFVRAWRGLFRNTYGFHMYTQYDVYVQWRVCSWMRRYAGIVAWYSLHRRI